MSIDDALVARAQGFATLTALIGSAPMRLYPADAASQNVARPYVVYQLISGPRGHAMGADPGTVRARVQFTCWGDTSTDCRSVADQIRACYARFRGTISSVVIDEIFVDDEHDLGRNADTRYWQRIVDLIVMHRE
jgi:uncharacterized protein DUF3168